MTFQLTKSFSETIFFVTETDSVSDAFLISTALIELGCTPAFTSST